MELNAIEARVLGALMEKAKTTPEYYPLTLNSLISACNQKTSRDPVTDYDEEEVSGAIETLREKHLAMRVDMAGSRTAKFRENASVTWELRKEEYALLTALLLRGPQTPGQLRQRTERIYPFAELPQVTDWLHRMENREDEPHTLVQSVGRTPGGKEIRYLHTLVPGLENFEAPVEKVERTNIPVPTGSSRLDNIEETLANLQSKVAHLEKLIDDITS
ncbi:DUF480 domain-containing protein [Puniceicoccales bacterium CK1056]|uniref:DUF480 domain-containing protein n=1 Tax=Oceanipulchritudo coccoides TaxID=2706888 RepID=A0A6B2M3W4_9BACT|nr:YceH family protein [Oceanipulchritudo coccoides]NDV62350.1 DUF480 domain-containing protein [Oceanipulchritudo coccoides]